MRHLGQVAAWAQAQAAQPGVLRHPKQLRSGIEQLVALAEGAGNASNGAATGILPGAGPVTQGAFDVEP